MRTNSLGYAVIAMTLVMLTGCVSTMCCGRASDAEMLADVAPSYPSPRPMAEKNPLSRDSLVGEWSGNIYSDIKNVMPRFRQVHVQSGILSRQTYKLFGDGQYVFTNKAADGTETSSTGNWRYENGFLTISETSTGGKLGNSIEMKVICYESNLIEFRMNDLRKYEDIFKQAPNVTSVLARHEFDGSLRTDIQMLNNGIVVITKMIQSPLRFSRVNSVK